RAVPRTCIPGTTLWRRSPVGVRCLKPSPASHIRWKPTTRSTSSQSVARFNGPPNTSCSPPTRMTRSRLCSDGCSGAKNTPPEMPMISSLSWMGRGSENGAWASARGPQKHTSAANDTAATMRIEGRVPLSEQEDIAQPRHDEVQEHHGQRGVDHRLGGGPAHTLAATVRVEAAGAGDDGHRDAITDGLEQHDGDVAPDHQRQVHERVRADPERDAGREQPGDERDEHAEDGE